MENIIKEGEQFAEGQDSTAGSTIEKNASSLQDTQGATSTGSSSGGFMGNLEQNAGDAYVNQGVNSVLNKEGVPTAMDGAIDGVVDTEANKFEKDL
ncbi:hypothetical protein LTR10_018923 [Elasticomyces elasticus]|uniref:Uncharacterized protein n=1 Tax=Exophiala sideris TaxID=1016849 RepID=A0A0D1WG01_9EURO|nr:hypothetical protein LTR10_018923 [Elasticomyces elasticus]KAK5034432.1 hypothetical protein LTS07_003353 [Exophiala sideris]KAK5185727.1 hypothetical protein LTR44_001776 [Eurotiomycetes sp. CCFEE 6388]KAK5042729.1 hypothetical protein LTR13_001577 [Exophiala sideris]KAK5065812.1 hypothetical protein LTR69_003362 [Exophiala sideris]